MAAAIEKAGLLYQTGYFAADGDPAHIFLKEQIAAVRLEKSRAFAAAIAATVRWVVAVRQQARRPGK